MAFLPINAAESSWRDSAVGDHLLQTKALLKIQLEMLENYFNLYLCYEEA